MRRDRRLLVAIAACAASFLLAFEYRQVAMGRVFEWRNMGDPCVEKVSPEGAFNCFLPLSTTTFEILLFLLVILLILIGGGIFLGTARRSGGKGIAATACFVFSHFFAYEACRVAFMREFEWTVLGTPCERAKRELEVAFDCFEPGQATNYEWMLALVSIILALVSIVLAGWLYFSSSKPKEQ